MTMPGKETPGPPGDRDRAQKEKLDSSSSTAALREYQPKRSEFLRELGCERLVRFALEQRVARYAALDPVVLHMLGADRWPPPLGPVTGTHTGGKAPGSRARNGEFGP
jgi:hypothetical protein